MSLDISLIDQGKEVYTSNFTHNLQAMAQAAGVYDILWRTPTNRKPTGAEILPILEGGLRDMRARPDHYKTLDAKNGWGTYEDFLRILEDIINACHLYPSAALESWG